MPKTPQFLKKINLHSSTLQNNVITMKIPEYYKNAKGVIIFNREQFLKVVNEHLDTEHEVFTFLARKHYAAIGYLRVDAVLKGEQCTCILTRDKLRVLKIALEFQKVHTIGYTNESISCGMISIITNEIDFHESKEVQNELYEHLDFLF